MLIFLWVVHAEGAAAFFSLPFGRRDKMSGRLHGQAVSETGHGFFCILVSFGKSHKRD